MNDPCEANPGPVEMETALTLLYDGSSPALRTIANHWIRRCGIGEERMLGMYRRAEYPWSEIAALMNSSPARLQKRFERAIRRARGLLEP